MELHLSAITFQCYYDKTTGHPHEIFPNCCKLYLRFFDCVFGSRISVEITFVSFETIYHFESTS